MPFDVLKQKNKRPNAALCVFRVSDVPPALGPSPNKCTRASVRIVAGGSTVRSRLRPPTLLHSFFLCSSSLPCVRNFNRILVSCSVGYECVYRAGLDGQRSLTGRGRYTDAARRVQRVGQQTISRRIRTYSTVSRECNKDDVKTTVEFSAR